MVLDSRNKHIAFARDTLSHAHLELPTSVSTSNVGYQAPPPHANRHNVVLQRRQAQGRRRRYWQHRFQRDPWQEQHTWTYSSIWGMHCFGKASREDCSMITRASFANQRLLRTIALPASGRRESGMKSSTMSTAAGTCTPSLWLLSMPSTRYGSLTGEWKGDA